MKKLLLMTTLLLASIVGAQAQKLATTAPQLKQKVVNVPKLDGKLQKVDINQSALTMARKNVAPGQVTSRPMQAKRAAGSAPSGLNASDITENSATVTWSGGFASYEVRYKKASEEGSAGGAIYFEDFESTVDNGLPEGWTSIDADGDGKDWYSLNQEDFAKYAHSGQGLMTSASWQSIALTPDNWLITPLLDLQGTVKMWMYGQDPAWSAEVFAVYLYIPAEGDDEEITTDDFSIELIPETTVTGSYVQYSADLSAYEGQQGYIAIRHFDVTDMFRLNLDDFGIYAADDDGDWTIVSTEDNSITLTDLEGYTAYQVQVRGILDRDEEGNPVWSDWSPVLEFTTLSGYVKATDVECTAVTQTTATLDWTEDDTAESWIVKYATCYQGDDGYLYANDYQYVTVYEKPCTLTGLQPGTIYVAMVCPAEDQTLWDSDDYAIFQTDDLDAPTDLEVIEVKETTATLSWTENGDATSWNVMYGAFDDAGNLIEESVNVVFADQVPFTLTDLMPDYWYAVMVQPVGGGEESWSDQITFHTEAFCVMPDVTDVLTTSNSATISWEGDESCDSYTLRYRGGYVGLYENFDAGMPNDWTVIDADGDGNTWTTNNSGYAQSDSYISGTGALTPDNWLISPKVALSGTLSIKVGARSSLYPDEFAIYLSTSGNDVDDFTTVLLEQTTSVYGFKTYTFDLSNYAGQKGYIAIRHFNCEDMWSLYVDEFSIMGEYEIPDWIEMTTTDTSITIEGLSPEKIYEFQVMSTTGQYDSKWTLVDYFTTEPLSISTAITNVTASEGTDTWYTIDGRKLSAKPMTKGVFIKNGQKVVNN